MKLLTKTSLYYLVLSIPILILSGFICYYFITEEVKDSNNELLLNRITLVERYLQNNDTVALHLLTKTKEAQVRKLVGSSSKFQVNRMLSDTLILDSNEHELAVNRMVTSYVTVQGSVYEIKIWRSTIEFTELIEGIFYLLVFILFFLFLISIVINFWISKTVWKPFYDTIYTLKAFRASVRNIPEFEPTTVTEFQELNRSLTVMMGKMIVDYASQKKFTENASHEIQTPLAVIKSKLDLLIQSKDITAHDIELISAIDAACSKLIGLNRSLLLLTKIENRQFETVESVSIATVVEKSISLYEDYITSESLHLNVVDDFVVAINADLCWILVNNLLQNAIRHTKASGRIVISIMRDGFFIRNSGSGVALDSETIFERFQKDSTAHQSIGLGLAIAKEIAEVSGLILTYAFIDGCHEFKLTQQ